MNNWVLLDNLALFVDSLWGLRVYVEPSDHDAVRVNLYCFGRDVAKHLSLVSQNKAIDRDVADDLAASHVDFLHILDWADQHAFCSNNERAFGDQLSFEFSFNA